MVGTRGLGRCFNEERLGVYSMMGRGRVNRDGRDGRWRNQPERMGMGWPCVGKSALEGGPAGY